MSRTVPARLNEDGGEEKPQDDPEPVEDMLSEFVAWFHENPVMLVGVGSGPTGVDSL